MVRHLLYQHQDLQVHLQNSFLKKVTAVLPAATQLARPVQPRQPQKGSCQLHLQTGHHLLYQVEEVHPQVCHQDPQLVHHLRYQSDKKINAFEKRNLQGGQKTGEYLQIINVTSSKIILKDLK